MKIGFTGTRVGMSDAQKDALQRQLVELGCDEFHHGDCLGADAEAHELARGLRLRIVVHPPSDPKLRAYKKGDVILSPESYLDRNHALVDTTDFLLVAPEGNVEVVRSGTWATKRYAAKKGKAYLVLRR